MNRLISLVLIFISHGTFAQNELTLEKCYELVKTNYPLTKQKKLLAKKNEFDIATIQKAKLPTLDLSAQASYQSDVTRVPIENPAFVIPAPNKDQYKMVLSVNQLIYYGGTYGAIMKVKESELKTQQQQLEVSLFQLKKQINQLYFSILLLQEKNELLKSNQVNLANKIAEIKAGIKFGVILPSSDNILEAEMLKIQQMIIEVNQNKKSLRQSLGQLIGQEVTDSVALHNPEIYGYVDNKSMRPELELFKLQQQQIENTDKLLSKKNLPKLFGFANGGYGNPGLNMLDNTFQGFYYVGLKFNWSVFDWSVNKKQRMSLAVNKEIIQNQEEVFQLNTNIELIQQQTEIDKIQSFIESDKMIIDLRKKILNSANTQLKNGIITSSAYITELTNLFEAENNLKTHEIQLLLAIANYNTIKGN